MDDEQDDTHRTAVEGQEAREFRANLQPQTRYIYSLLPTRLRFQLCCLVMAINNVGLKVNVLFKYIFIQQSILFFNVLLLELHFIKEILICHCRAIIIESSEAIMILMEIKKKCS